MRWIIDFVGRQVGAIGITYPMTVEVQAESYVDAVNKLYEKYEHCTKINARPLESAPDEAAAMDDINGGGPEDPAQHAS